MVKHFQRRLGRLTGHQEHAVGCRGCHSRRVLSARPDQQFDSQRHAI